MYTKELISPVALAMKVSYIFNDVFNCNTLTKYKYLGLFFKINSFLGSFLVRSRFRVRVWVRIRVRLEVSVGARRYIGSVSALGFRLGFELGLFEPFFRKLVKHSAGNPFPDCS